MRTGTTVSVLAHGAVLAWALLSLVGHPLDVRQVDAIPVALVSVADVTSLPKAAPPAPVEAKPAPPLPTPPALPKAEPPVPVEAKPVPPPPTPPAPPPPAPAADAKPATPPQPAPTSPPPAPSTGKPAPEAPPTVASVPQPAPSPPAMPVAAKPAPEAPTTVASVPQPAAKPRAAPPPKPDTGPDRPFLFDRIATFLNQPQPPAQKSAPRPAPTPAPTTPKPQSDSLALGSLIASASADPHLTVSEIDALRTRIAQCWTPPSGWTDPAEVRVVMIIALSPDGGVTQTPQVVEAPVGRYANTAPESAVRAVRACAPYVLPPEKYPDWKEVKITFDPRAMGN